MTEPLTAEWEALENLRVSSRSLLLASFTTAELQAEVDRRRVAVVEGRQPAGRCANCGEVWYYQHGYFKPAWFEQEAAEFKKAHARCQPCVDGGGI